MAIAIVDGKNQTQKKKKCKANAKKGGKKASSTEDTVRESESEPPKSIKGIKNPKLQERKMDGSGTTNERLKLQQNPSTCLEPVHSTLKDVQRELLLLAAKHNCVRDLDLADDAASLIANL